MDRNDYDGAELALKRAIEIFPDYADAHSNLGIVYATRGLYATARLELRKAVEIDPEFDSARQNLMEVEMSIGRLTKPQ